MAESSKIAIQKIIWIYKIESIGTITQETSEPLQPQDFSERQARILRRLFNRSIVCGNISMEISDWKCARVFLLVLGFSYSSPPGKQRLNKTFLSARDNLTEHADNRHRLNSTCVFWVSAIIRLMYFYDKLSQCNQLRAAAPTQTSFDFPVHITAKDYSIVFHFLHSPHFGLFLN